MSLQQAISRVAAALRRTETGPFTATVVRSLWDESERLAIQVLPTGGEEILTINRLSPDVHAFAASSAPWDRLVLVQSIQGRLYAACLIEEAS